MSSKFCSLSYFSPKFKREFKKLRRLLQRKRHIKMEMFYDYSMFVTLQETGEVHFCLFGTNGFYVKAENEKLSLRACVMARTSNMKTSCRALADQLRHRLHKKTCRTCSTITFPHSTNQIMALWCCRGRVAVVISSTPQCVFNTASPVNANAILQWICVEF